MSYLWLAGAQPRPTIQEIREILDQIWLNDSNRLTGSDVQYNINGAR